MKDGIVWNGVDEEDAKLFLKRHVLPADPDAKLEQVEFTNRAGKKVKRWQIKAKAILGSKPVIIKKS